MHTLNFEPLTNRSDLFEIPYCTYGEKTLVEEVAAYFETQIKDKVILVTGANLNGIGGPTVLVLAAHSPKTLIITGRNMERLDEITSAIKKSNPVVHITAVKVDLGALDSCKAAARDIIDDPEISQIDIVINNAGIWSVGDRSLTPEGTELQFATNHLGHFILTNGVMPKILKAAQASPRGSARIVNVSSSEANSSPIRFSDINLHKRSAEVPGNERPDWKILNSTGAFEDGVHTGRLGYAQSKTANVLFSVELNKRLFEKYGILSVALHPGAMSTELARQLDPETIARFLEQLKSVGFYIKSLGEGAYTTLVAALDPALSPPDVFLSDCQNGEVAQWGTDSFAAEKLWQVSEEYVGQSYVY